MVGGVLLVGELYILLVVIDTLNVVIDTLKKN